MTDDDLEIGRAKQRVGTAKPRGEQLCLGAGVAEAYLRHGSAVCLNPVRGMRRSAVSKGSTQAQQQSEADQRAKKKDRGQADGTGGG